MCLFVSGPTRTLKRCVAIEARHFRFYQTPRETSGRPRHGWVEICLNRRKARHFLPEQMKHKLSRSSGSAEKFDSDVKSTAVSEAKTFFGAAQMCLHVVAISVGQWKCFQKQKPFFCLRPFPPLNWINVNWVDSDLKPALFHGKRCIFLMCGKGCQRAWQVRSTQHTKMSKQVTLKWLDFIIKTDEELLWAQTLTTLTGSLTLE